MTTATKTKSESLTKPAEQPKAEERPNAKPAPDELVVGSAVRFKDHLGEPRNAIVHLVWQNGTVDLTYVVPGQKWKAGSVVTAKQVPIASLR
jgi:hypothetical protein